MHLDKKPLAAERMVGLDVGDHNVSASLLGFGMHGTIILEAAGVIPINIADSNANIAASIRKQWKESSFASYTVCACLQSSAVLFKHFSKPELTKDELKASLQLDAEQAMQVPLAKLAMDIHLRSNTADAPNHKDDSCEGFYVATPRADVDRLLHILDMASLFPAIIDVSCIAASNAFLRLNKTEDTGKPLCYCCFNSHHADIVILQNNECIYTRSVAIHGADTHKTAAYIGEVVIEVIKHSQMVMGNDPISRICLTGTAPGSDEVEQICRDRTGLPVESWNPLDSIQLSHHLKKKWSGDEKKRMGIHLARSLGLALRREG